MERHSETMKAPLLHQNLTLKRRGQDPMLSYSLVAILGEGSMGSVSKVLKRDNVGSARSGFLQKHSANILGKFNQCWRLCCDDNNDDDTRKFNPRDLISSLSSHDSLVEDGVSPKSDLSSMIRFGHQDTFFALKSIHLSMARDQTLREELKNEVEILKTLDHPNIVRAVETFEYRNSLYVVLELCSGGDLYSRDPYSEEEAAHICQSVLSAVAYMHRQGISHRDLKYENVMFASPHPTADVKIIDFGLSTKYGVHENDTMHDPVGTIYCMSPEVLEGTYTKQADIWACGVLAFMLLSSSMPFFGKSRDIVVDRIKSGKFAFRNPRWKSVSEDAKNFVLSLMQYYADNRPTAEQAARDPWFKMTESKNSRRRKYSISAIPENMNSVQASIENFANHSKLKKLALMVIAHRSTDDEIGFLRRMFKKYDDQQGCITLAGFKKALGDYLYSDDEIEKIFKGMDIDGNGAVHYFEFLAASMEAHGFINEERLADAFDTLDADGSGTISVNDLRVFLGNEVSDASIDRIIDEGDLDANRQVDYNEFLRMWNIESDSMRQKTLDSVARRRRPVKDQPSRIESRSNSFAGTRVTKNIPIASNIAKAGDEFDHEVGYKGGDAAFGLRKELSIRRASSMKLPTQMRTRIKSADI